MRVLYTGKSYEVVGNAAKRAAVWAAVRSPAGGWSGMGMASRKMEAGRTGGVLGNVTRRGALNCLLGLAAMRVWLQCILFDSYTQSDDGLFTIVNNLGYGLAILVAALLALRHPPRTSMQNRLGWLAFLLTALTPLGLLAVPGPMTGAPLVAVGMLVGVAGALGAGVWSVVYVRLGARQAVLYSFASLALGSAGGLALSFLPSDPSQVVCIFMAAISQLCYRRALTVTSGASAEVSASNARPRPVYDGEPRSTVLIILGGLAIFGFALGISRGYPLGAPVPMGVGLRVVHQLGVVALSLFVIWWAVIRGRRLSFSLLWRIEIIVAAVGMLVLSAFPGHLTGFAVAMINIADSFMLGVLWITMQDVARHSSLHPYAVFGVAWSVRVFSREVGRVLVLVLGSMAAPPQTGAILGVVTAAVAVSTAVLLSEGIPHARPFFSHEEGAAAEPASVGPVTIGPVATEPAGARSAALKVQEDAVRTEKPDSDRPVEMKGADDIALSAAEVACLERLRGEWGLSEREAQVAVLIVQGRSKVAIAQRLYLTENTVRTHAKNAYAKLGVRSKAELGELLAQMVN